MNVVFFGTSDFGLPALAALAARHALLAVVTTPDKPQGRNLQPAATPVKEWARSQGVPVFDYPKEDPAPLLSTLKGMRPDVFVVISFGRLLRSDYLTAARHGSLNVHASLLPRHRGASPMQSAMLARDDKTGVSVMRMIERLDAGDVLLQKETPIAPEDDIVSLKARLSALGAEALIESLEQIERATAKFTVQDDRLSSYAKKIKKEDGKIDWAMDAEAITARVRAFLGWPGTHAFFKGKRLLVLKARTVPAAPGQAPGTVIEAGESALIVACGAQSGLSIERLQLEGKKAMAWSEFRRGFAIAPGERLE